jgi:hypothetical protein
VTVDLRATWDGRPETWLIGIPQLAVPDGGAVALGTSSSSFDGNHATWTTKLHVRLPEDGGPWWVGPATVPVSQPGQPSRELTAPRVRVGKASPGRQALGRVLGSGILVLVAVSWFGLRWRTLPPLPGAEARGPDLSEPRRLFAERPPGWQESLLTSLLELGADEQRVQAHLEAVRYGGETIAEDEIGALLASLEEQT